MTVDNYLDYSVAPTTLRVYKGAWRRFHDWCTANQTPVLPCDPTMLALYLTTLADRGLKTASMKLAVSAVDFYHAQDGLAVPGGARMVRATMRGIRRKLGKRHTQKEGLTAEIFAHVLKLNTGIEESYETLTILAVMRDAMLRASELGALKTDDFTPMPDASGRLLIQRSKTDQFGEGATQFLSDKTTAMVVRWLSISPRNSGAFLFGHRHKERNRRELARMIKRVIYISGINPSTFSTHSPRIGMAQDLLKSGQQDAAIAQAGRWTSTGQVLNYTRHLSAGKAAVANYYLENNT